MMSGSLDKGRQSVFAVLDRLRRPSTHGTEAPAGAALSSTPGRECDGDDRERDGSVMLKLRPNFAVVYAFSLEKFKAVSDNLPGRGKHV
jgi:hypothetical protein